MHLSMWMQKLLMAHTRLSSCILGRNYFFVEHFDVFFEFEEPSIQMGRKTKSSELTWLKLMALVGFFCLPTKQVDL